ncbi:ABC transporter substrate-binding protein [Cohnella thermotolerans]|uniref:ABC transporter substrate-binding protein n=1 Tax=Cohnella thermotolerans TaxID=329858 RepID=UPI00040350EF|nr:extracellular solute-binding protein [Cohnella thermotolerans]
MNVKRLYRTVPFLLLSLLLGCQPSAPSFKDKPITLRIGYSSEHDFAWRYGNLLSQEFPQWTVEIVPMKDWIGGNTTAAEWLRDHPVDLLYIPGNAFRPLIDQGLLRNLDAELQADAELADAFLPSILKLARLYGNGHYYGLVPSFHCRAIAVNLGKFAENGISPPSSDADWPEIVSLARRFDKGLLTAYSEPFDWILAMGQGMGLSTRDAATGAYTLDTPSWRELWNLAVEGITSRAVSLGRQDASGFLAGDYAMAVVESGDIERLERSSIDWSLVPYPGNPAAPDLSYVYAPDGFLAIPRVSGHPEEAWEAIRFLLSDKAANRSSRSEFGRSSLKAAFDSGGEGTKRNYAALTERTPALMDAAEPAEPLRVRADQAFRTIVDRSIPVRSALSNLQKEADEGLFQQE